MSRRVRIRFSHSYAFKHALLDLQHQNGLPEYGLILPLHMLERLYE